eukprot:gene555-8067_t
MEKRTEIGTVVVYCSSSETVDKKYFEAAKTLGETLAKADINVVYGGGQLGLMGRLAQSAHENGSKVTAVIPPFFNTKSVHVTEEIVVTSMHERKQKMADLSDGIVALPGGIGTLEEVLEAMTWRQLSLNHHKSGKQKPIVLVNVDGFYDKLIAMLDQLIEQSFLKGKQFTVVDDPKDIVKVLYQHYDEELSKEEIEFKEKFLTKK